MKPVTLPMLNLLLVRVNHGALQFLHALNTWNTKDPLILVREYLDELRQRVRPMLENPLRPRALGCDQMAVDGIAQQFNIALIDHPFQIDARKITAFLLEITILVEDVSQSP